MVQAEAASGSNYFQSPQPMMGERLSISLKMVSLNKV